MADSPLQFDGHSKKLQCWPIKIHRVAAENSFLVFLREIVASEQFVDFVAALSGVKNLVGEVAAEEK
jgi:hypothetical protein